MPGVLLLRSPLARRVLWLVRVFVALELTLLVVAMIGLQILAAQRGFGEALRIWSTLRQDAVSSLQDYARSGNGTDLDRFRMLIARDLNQRRVRAELGSAHPDRETVRRGLLQAGNHPDDIDDILRVARWVHLLPGYDEMLETWGKADGHATQLLGVATALEESFAGDLPVDVDAALRRIQRSDELLRQTGVEFAGLLGESSRRIKRWLMAVVLSGGIVMLVAGVGLGTLFVRRLDRTEVARKEGERRYEALVASDSVGIWQLSEDGRTEFANRAALEIFGRDNPESDPHGWERCFSPEGLTFLRTMREKGRGREPSTYEVEIRRQMGEGEPRRLLISRSPLRGEDGRPQGAIGTCIDITERWQAERALRESERRLRVMLEQLPATVWTTDLSLRYTFALARGERTSGERPGRSIYEVFGSEDPQAEPIAAHHRALAGESVTFESEIDGRTFQSHVEPLRDDRDRITGTVGVSLDVTERKNIEARLAYLASRDPLTDLYNRRRFEEELSLLLQRAEHTGEGGALLWCDLDDFKEVNDRFGHRAGDEMLVRVALAFRREARHGETLARLGGDEFGVLMPGADLTEAVALTRRLQAAIRKEATVSGNGATASIGVVAFPQQGRTTEEVLTHADIAMYRAKREGRDRFAIYRAEGPPPEVRDLKLLSADGVT